MTDEGDDEQARDDQRRPIPRTWWEAIRSSNTRPATPTSAGDRIPANQARRHRFERRTHR